MRRYTKDNINDKKSAADEKTNAVDSTDDIKQETPIDSENIKANETDEIEYDLSEQNSEEVSQRSGQSRIVERRLTRRMLGMDEEYKPKNRRRDSRGKNKSAIRKKRAKNENRVLSWFYKSVFSLGRMRVTRLAAISTFLVLALVVSSFTMWAIASDILSKKMPIENNDLIPSKKIIYIKDGSETKLIKADEGKVSDIVEEVDIELGEKDKVYPDSDTEIYNRMTLEIKRAKEVTIQSGAQEHIITFYNGTVEDALKEAGLNYDDDDIVEPALNTEVKENTTIKFDVVEVKTVTEEVEVEFETEYGETSTVLKGMYAVTQKGVDGLAEVTYEVTYVNGEETSRKPIEEVMIKEPVNRVELYGTALTKIDDDENDGEEKETDVKNPDEQSTNPTVPGTSSTYVDQVSCLITAYTHTGSTTATGTWPRSTRTLDNPGSCAVVPDTFPYGSLLYVTGYGYCIAEDTGGFRHDPDRWNQIDVFMNTVQECLNWGRRRDVKVYVIRYGY